jgi:hypothetical protein
MTDETREQLYHLEVRPPDMLAGQWEDEQDPLVQGVIRLTNAERVRLDARLHALEDSDDIGPWTLAPVTFVHPADILPFIVDGLDEDEAAKVTAEWERAGSADR